jgi:hypothetical protein
MNDMIITVPAGDRAEFEAEWEKARRDSEFPGEYSVPPGDLVDHHDGKAIVEYLVPLLQNISGFLSGFLPQWLGRNKASAKIDGTEFNNMSVADIERLLTVIARCKAREATRQQKH